MSLNAKSLVKLLKTRLSAADVTAMKLRRQSLNKFTIKSGKACQPEHWVVRLLLDLAAPVPGRGQAAIDAGASIKEVVGASAIKGMPKEVYKDGFPAGPEHLCSAQWLQALAADTRPDNQMNALHVFGSIH